MVFSKQKNKFVVDTSIIINQKVSELIQLGKIPKYSTIIIPIIALREIEHQANRREKIGNLGLQELKRLQDLAKKEIIKLIYEDVAYTKSDVTSAKLGGLDDLIVKLAIRNKAIFITADRVQSEVAVAQGCKTYFYDFSTNSFIWKNQSEISTTLSFEKFFDKDTLSIHLLQDSFAFAKIRKNKKTEYKKISQKPFSYDEIKRIIHEIKNHPSFVSFVPEDINQKYVFGKIKEYRIIITNPPLSIKTEIIIIKQRTIKTFKDYKIPKQYTNFLLNAKGIIVAGEAGGGKTSFARALFLESSGCGNKKTAKIIESNPEQAVCDNINQYNKTSIATQDLKQLILSSRTEELLFDEIETPKDIELFTSFRLANITTISTINISNKVCALHFIFSNIPFNIANQTIDGIVFLNKDGSIDKILSPKLNIKKENISIKLVDLNGKEQFECFKQQNDLIVKNLH